MNPRMRENGIRIQPENEFQIRNPWIPPTPDQNLSRSNGISIDQNDNRLRRRNRSELLNLLNRPSEQTSNYNKVGGNSNFPGRLNQIGMGNGISTSGDCSNQTVPLNQSSGSYDINHYQMGNRIFTTGGNSNLTLPVNQNSILYDINSSPIGNRVFTTGDCSNLTVPSYQSSGSCDMNNYLMGNGISTSGNSSNFTVPLNQSRGSYDMNNYQIGYGILENGNNFNFDRPMNHISSSKMVDHQMGNGNSGAYLNCQTQSYRNDIASNRGFIGNMVQQPSFSAINNPQIVIPKTDAVISSPLLNMNIRPLSPPRGINTDMNLPNAPSVLNSYSEVDSSWTAGNFTNLLLGDDIVNLGPNRLLRSDNSSQMLGDGYHVRVQHNNLNSTPRHGGNTGTNNASSFQFAPITPDHKNILEMQKQAQMLKFLVDDDSGQEHDKMENLISSIGNEIIENHCSELLQTIENHGSENKMSEERGDQNVIDLNETPKQKTPKRRKHRPKVVIEGKPKRTPKPKTPTNGESEKNPSKKRKYVQKNRDAEVENTPSQPTDVIYMAKVPNFESREESCRRKLNFDFEKSEKGENQHKTHYQSNQPVLDLNLNYPTNELPVKSLAWEENRGPANPSEIINYDPLNVIATNVSTRRKKNRENRNLKGELNKKISQPNHNLERTKEMKWKSTHQMVERDVGNFKGFCGTKGEEAPHVEQVGPSSEKNESRSEKVGNSSEETCKKQKMENDSQNMSYGPEKGYPISGTSGENGEQIVPEKKIASISDGVHSTGYFDVVKNSKFHSEITSKKIAASGYQQMTENYQTGMQNNTLNLCREVSFCKHKVPSKEPKDTLHEYPQLSKTARGRPKVFKYSKKMVDEITFRLQSLSISGEKYKKCEYALVPCGGGGAMMLYEPKRRKPRPKVDLDPETDRIWKLLMGKEGAEASKGENRNKEKWWEEERRVFQGRAESFIARMHLVQGNRRFSPWKGSVVDSIIGVFLTQNVSDQLSSSAFMALAAKFPLGVATPDQGSDQSGTSILTEEPEIQKISPYEPIECFDKIINQPIHRQLADPYLGSLGKGKMGIASEHNQIIIEENASTSQNSSTSSIHNINGEIQSYSRSSSEMENSKNGGNPIKINGFTSSQHENRTVPLQVIKYPENESLCFNKRSMLYHKEKSELDYNKQIQGSNSFIDLNSFSLLNRQNGSSIFNMQNSNIPSNFLQLLMTPENAISETDCCEISREEYRSSFPSKAPEINKGNCIKYHNNRVGHKADTMKNSLFQQNGLKNNQTENIDPFGFLRNHPTVEKSSIHQVHQTKPPFLNPHQVERSRISESQHPEFNNITRTNDSGNQVPIISKKHTGQNVGIQEGTKASNNQVFSGETNIETSAKNLKKRQTQEKVKKESFDWDSLRRTLQSNGGKKERNIDASDSMDYEAMRCADVNVISNSIRIRGMNNMLSERIKDFLNRVVTDHGSIDLEWLRDVPPDKAKDYLLSIRGLGLKSVECVRLLTLHHLAFPVDTNVGRIAVRLGWVPLQPLPESLQLHLLEMYPVLETVQKYLWPRLCKLDQKTLYELHYQLITFGKVFCTKSKPNCNACPMRGECRHFASAFASARLALPAPEEKGIMGSTISITTNRIPDMAINPLLLQPSVNNGEREFMVSRCEPIIEEPATPEPEIIELPETDIEDAFYEDPDEIPTIRLNVEQLTVNLRNFMETHTDLRGEDMSKALVALAPEVASIPAPKLKYVLRLRTERQVYVLTDTHPLVKELDKREPDDPSPYLLALLAPGEEAGLDQPSGKCCESNEKECSSVDKEANSLTVRGTLLIPCRTAMRGSFPLNGTYFQVNEVFADHESSLNPINVPRECLWHLETRTVFFGTSATSIFRGMTTKEIQNSFWRGFVCVRGFDRKSRAPRPLNHNLHISQNKRVKKSNPA